MYNQLLAYVNTSMCYRIVLYYLIVLTMFLIYLSLSRMILDEGCHLNIQRWSRSESHIIYIEDNKLSREESIECLKNKYSKSEEKFTQQKEQIRESIRSTFTKSERDDYQAFKNMSDETPGDEVIRLKDRKVVNDKKSLRYYKRLKNLIFDTEKSKISAITTNSQKKVQPSKQLIETKKKILVIINNAFNDDLMDMQHKEIMFNEITSKLHDLTSKKNSREVEVRKKRKNTVIEDITPVKKIKLASSVFEEVDDITPTVFEEVDDIAPTVFEEVDDITPTVFEEVDDITPTVFEEVDDITPTVFEEVDDIAPTVFEEVDDIPTTVFEKIYDITPTLSEKS